MSASQPAKEVPAETKKWGMVAIILGVLSFVGAQYVVGSVVYVLFGKTLSTSVQFYLYGGISVISLLLLLQILRYYHASFRDLGLNSFKIEYIIYALLGLPAYFLLSWILTGVTGALFPGLDLSQAQDVGFDDAANILQLAMVFISLVVLPPVVEELLFRGLIFKGLLRYVPVIGAAIVTSIIFGALHGQWNVAIDTFALSLILCFLVYKTKSLWPAIFLHAAKNGMAFILLFIFKIAG